MKKILFSLLFGMVVAAQAQPLPPVTTPWSRLFLRQTSGSGAMSLLLSSGGSLAVVTNVLYVSTTGSDTVIGTNATAPCLTISNALRYASAGSTILIGPGVFNLGTNQIILPNNVNLVGSGMYDTELIGYADEAGVESGYFPTGGPQICAGDNCIIQDFTITCDTNAIVNRLDLANAGASQSHSGTWAGFGTSWFNPPAHGNFTNVVINNVNCRRSFSDAWHFNHTNRCEVYFNNCVGDTEGVPWNMLNYTNNASTLKSVFVLNNCLSISRQTLMGKAINDAGLLLPPVGSACYIQCDKHVQMNNCYGYIFPIAGYISPLGFVVGNVPSSRGGQDPLLIVNGGMFSDGGVTNNFSQPWILGWAFENSTNVGGFSKLISPTNFVSGLLLTNFYPHPIEVSCAVKITTASATAGSSNLRIDATTPGGTMATLASIGAQTTASTLADNYTNYIRAYIPAGWQYWFTNTSTGSGNSATIVGGTGQLVVH